MLPVITAIQTVSSKYFLNGQWEYTLPGNHYCNHFKFTLKFFRQLFFHHIFTPIPVCPISSCIIEDTWYITLTLTPQEKKNIMKVQMAHFK